MRKIQRSISSVLMLVIQLGIVLTTLQPVKAQSVAPAEGYPGKPVCLPDVFLNTPSDCLPLGPSATLTNMAKKGEEYPPKPLPARRPDAALTKSPVNIAKINIDPTLPVGLFSSLEAAVDGSSPLRKIAPGRGLRYVSYTSESRYNDNPYVQLKTGEWVRASPSGFSAFQGLEFTKTPTTSFGWVIDTIQAYSAPSFTAPVLSDTIYRETPVQIFEIVTVDDMEWYRIGDNTWVPYLKARRARVDTNPPKGVTNDRWISVDLYDQVVTVYENRKLVFATLVSTGGEPFYTRPGLFQIYQKKELETMTGAFDADKMDYYYLEDVPWTMYFDKARALHGAYWRPWFGVPGTHGCVNFSLGDANWLFHWANEGDWVYVWDPSGKTPVDPSLYGDGGA